MVAMAEALETYPVECSGCYEPMIEALETYPVECNGCYDWSTRNLSSGM